MSMSLARTRSPAALSPLCSNSLVTHDLVLPTAAAVCNCSAESTYMSSKYTAAATGTSFAASTSGSYSAVQSSVAARMSAAPANGLSAEISWNIQGYIISPVNSSGSADAANTGYRAMARPAAHRLAPVDWP